MRQSENSIIEEIIPIREGEGNEEYDGDGYFVGGNERVYVGTVKYLSKMKHPKFDGVNKLMEKECFYELIFDIKNAVEQLCEEKRCKECENLIDEFNRTQKIQFTICNTPALRYDAGVTPDDLDLSFLEPFWRETPGGMTLASPPKLLTNNEIKDDRDYERIVELAQKWEDFYILMLNILSSK